VTTSPPGAEVYVKPYQTTAEARWRRVGQSPLDQASLPRGVLHWKITKEGYATVEGCCVPEDGPAQFTLDRTEDIPEGMVRVLGNRYRSNIYGFEGLEQIALQDYFIDRFEVTNQQFKKFVDQGGYEKREYWHHDFIHGNNTLAWEKGVKQFLDATRKPGPSVWHGGTYPAGEEDYPVRGISWYEAAAYAAFAGKSLPTVTHWIRASGVHYAYSYAVGEILRLSNLGSNGPAAVGAYQGLGPFGTYDMAGNVKEWCANKAEGDTRYILGGSWNEPGYMFYHVDAQFAFDRSPHYGFRCVKYLLDIIPEAALADMPLTQRRTGKETPVSDATFEIIRGIYAHDKQAPLNSKTTSREETADWIHETIQFDAGYGNERITAHLYLPRRGKPPYQTVVHFPGIGSWDEPSFAGKEWKYSGIPDLVKSGRAFLWPIYVGTFERRRAIRPGRSFQRDKRIQLAKDLGRSLDYLEQRPDIDHARMAYYGFSYGAELGNIHLAVEDRFQVALLISAGFPKSKAPWPELDQVNFAPRVKIPVLMLGGRNDNIFPLESSQLVMYELLGTPKKDKRHVILDAGHILPQEIVNKEMVSWLDRYLGPVR
jgi:cephalosporin-C deacetylase-like acetyl esterase